MRKFIFLSFVLYGCIEGSKGKIQPENSHYTYQIYIIDGCEYIGNSTISNNAVLTHKGNCKNKIHSK